MLENYANFEDILARVNLPVIIFRNYLAAVLGGWYSSVQGLSTDTQSHTWTGSRSFDRPAGVVASAYWDTCNALIKLLFQVVTRDTNKLWSCLLGLIILDGKDNFIIETVD